MKRILEYTETERKRLDKAMREYDEQRGQWTILWFLMLLGAVLLIGYLLGKYYHG